MYTENRENRCLILCRPAGHTYLYQQLRYPSQSSNLVTCKNVVGTVEHFTAVYTCIIIVLISHSTDEFEMLSTNKQRNGIVYKDFMHPHMLIPQSACHMTTIYSDFTLRMMPISTTSL